MFLYLFVFFFLQTVCNYSIIIITDFYVEYISHKHAVLVTAAGHYAYHNIILYIIYITICYYVILNSERLILQ